MPHNTPGLVHHYQALFPCPVLAATQAATLPPKPLRPCRKPSSSPPPLWPCPVSTFVCLHPFTFLPKKFMGRGWGVTVPGRVMKGLQEEQHSSLLPDHPPPTTRVFSIAPNRFLSKTFYFQNDATFNYFETIKVSRTDNQNPC